jgi:environmental stress-induced protein Ves
MRIIKPLQQKVSTWSGGTTTELFIHPPESEYALRNFDFRISTATVELETSSFTSLPGFERILMIVKGELFIQHKNQYNKKLSLFDSDQFDGGWQTTAKGLVTDFNIIFAKGKTAQLAAHQLKPNQKLNLPSKIFSFGYLASGKALLNQSILNLGDFVVLEKEIAVIHAESDSVWLEIWVY